MMSDYDYEEKEKESKRINNLLDKKYQNEVHSK